MLLAFLILLTVCNPLILLLDIDILTFKHFGTSTNNTFTFQLPKNDNKYHYHLVTVKIDDPKLFWRIFDDNNKELGDLHFKNGELTNITALKIIVDGHSSLFALEVTIICLTKQSRSSAPVLSAPAVEAQSFHSAKIIPQDSRIVRQLKLKYRLYGTENWIEKEDMIIKVQYADEVYEAQLYHHIEELGVTIESPIIVVKEHWKQMSKFLRINREELHVLKTFSANFYERFVGDGIFSTTIERIGSTRDTIILNSFASTLFFSKQRLLPGERYLFKFFVPSLSRPRSTDYVSISQEFTVPPELEYSPAQTEQWITKFGNGTLKFSGASKIREFSLTPNGWFTLEISRSSKNPPKILAGTCRQLTTGSEFISLALRPLIKDKYIERNPLVIEGDESGAPEILLLAEIVLQILSGLPSGNTRLVCKYWYQLLPLQFSVRVEATSCVVQFAGESSVLKKVQ
jgi:hypothetical protein